MARSTKPSEERPRRRRLFDDPNAPPVPAELEKWERRVGFVAAFLVFVVLIVFLLASPYGLHMKVSAPTKAHPHAWKWMNLIAEFWVGVVLGVATLFATRYEKRQILGLLVAFSGLDLSFFGGMFGLPFIVGGAWLMLRASRRTRQLSAKGEGPAARRAARAGRAESNGKGETSKQAASKRYTPPKKRKAQPASSASVRVGRGGKIVGDLPRKSDDEEEPSGMMGFFAGRKKEPEKATDDD